MRETEMEKKSKRLKGLRGEKVKIRTEEVTSRHGMNGNESLKINEKRREKKADVATLVLFIFFFGNFTALVPDSKGAKLGP